MDDVIKFPRIIRNVGGSSAVTIPKELMDFLATGDDTEVFLIGETYKGKKRIIMYKTEENKE